MGLENRDYARGANWSGNYGGFGGAGGFPAVVKWLIIANVAVFILQVAVTRPVTALDLGVVEADDARADVVLDRRSLVEDWLKLDPQDVAYRGQVWRLVTYAFLHDRQHLFHILFNMLFLFWFGKTLEQMYGSREFLLFYLAGALASGIVFLAMGLAMQKLNPAIGASGAVMGVVMLYAIHYPRQQILLFLVLPVEIRFVVAFYVLYDLFPVLAELGGRPVRDGVAHAAHLGGLAFGFCYWKFHWRLERLISGLRWPKLRVRPRSRRDIRLYHPEPERPAEPSESRAELSARVDAILQKISEQGEASLSAEERETLKLASRVFRNR